MGLQGTDDLVGLVRHLPIAQTLVLGLGGGTGMVGVLSMAYADSGRRPDLFVFRIRCVVLGRQGSGEAFQ